MVCKECNATITEKNYYPKDKRYCIQCGEKREKFFSERRYTLNSLQNMSLQAKIVQTKYLIKEAVREFGLEKVYISYSGGRDSTVLSHIAKQLYPNILHIFSNTTNEYPETIQHIKWEKEYNNTNIITVLPVDKNGDIWTFKRVVENYGFPMFSKRVANAIRTYQHALSTDTKNNSFDYINRNFKKYIPYISFPISDKCCDKLKKEPLRRKAKELGLSCSIIGIRASESYQRQNDWIKFGCNVFYKHKDNQSRPLAFWTDDDINEYISTYNVRLSKLYTMGYTRNGCMYCGFGVHLEKEPNRYQRLKVTHPVQYTYLVNNFEDIFVKCHIAY